MQRQMQLSGIAPRTLSLQGYRDFVFVSRRHKPLMNKVVQYYIKAFVQYYNKKEQEEAQQQGREPQCITGFGLHAFRHYFISRCIECGMNPKAVQEIVGHAKYQFTMDVYTHYSMEFKKEQFQMFFT